MRLPRRYHRRATSCVTMHVMAYPPTGSTPSPPSGGAGSGQPPGGSWQEERPDPEPPPRKHLTTGVLAGVAGVVLVVLVLCCVGGVLAVRDDESEPSESSTSPSETRSSTGTSTTTSSTSSSTSSTTSTSPSSTTTSSSTTTPSTSATSSTTSPPSASSTGPIPTVAFPDSFGEWTKSDSATDTLAIYRKGEAALSVVAIPRDQVDGFYDRIWEDTSKHEDITCGKLSTSSNYQCVGVVDGNGVLVSGSSETAAETAQILTDLLAAIAEA